MTNVSGPTSLTGSNPVPSAITKDTSPVVQWGKEKIQEAIRERLIALSKMYGLVFNLIYIREDVYKFLLRAYGVNEITHMAFSLDCSVVPLILRVEEVSSEPYNHEIELIAEGVPRWQSQIIGIKQYTDRGLTDWLECGTIKS